MEKSNSSHQTSILPLSVSNETSPQAREEITGEIIRITYHDPDTLFTVAKLKPFYSSQVTVNAIHSKTRNGEVALVGKLPHLQVGHTVHCLGFWEEDPRHGPQFHVLKIRYELPKDPQAIERLLSSGFIKGVGPKTAEKIVKAFGADTFTIFEKEPERLHEIEGLSKAKVDQIIQAWKLHTVYQEVLLVLLSWGLTHSQSAKVLRLWGSDTLQQIRQNPYQLAKEIHGIGFILADKIASSLGFKPDSPERIDFASLYFLWEMTSEGHTCFPLTNFVSTAAEKLGIPRSPIEERISHLFEGKKISLFRKEETLYIAPLALFNMERSIALDLLRLSSSKQSVRELHAQNAVDWAEKQLNMTFAQGQKNALIKTLSSKVSIITGGPGTGKSTITKALLAVLGKLTKKIVLAAPTGRAAKRMTEITHSIAHTIHRLLKFDPIKGGFTHNRSNPISCDVVIVDETSMVDTQLMYSFLQAVPDGAKVIFVGDVNQLPSIGPGCVLKNMIESEMIAVSRLDEIFRQAKRSKIIENAHRVNQGQMPWLKNFPGSDFLFLSEAEADNVRKSIFSLVTKTIPEKYGFDPKSDIQVMAPMRKGTCGIDQINFDLQSYFSLKREELPPPKEGLVKSRFYDGDKVIQLKNNYSKEVFNGDIGTIDKIEDNGDSKLTYVRFDDKVITYDESELDELALAWAVSIHKYQGSEAPCVVIPLHTQHFKLLTKNLLYTGITRGKKLVIVVGSIKAVAIAIKNTTGEERWTQLQETIVREFGSKSIN